jgi:DNA-binding CsgD family transcriptional regulator
MRAHGRSPRGSGGRATDREVRVVEAVLVAGSEKEAAHRLGLSHSTVKHHLANARSKVGATTTAQLVGILAPRRAHRCWARDFGRRAPDSPYGGSSLDTVIRTPRRRGAVHEPFMYPKPHSRFQRWMNGTFSKPGMGQARVVSRAEGQIQAPPAGSTLAGST